MYWLVRITNIEIVHFFGDRIEPISHFMAAFHLPSEIQFFAFGYYLKSEFSCVKYFFIVAFILKMFLLSICRFSDL